MQKLFLYLVLNEKMTIAEAFQTLRFYGKTVNPNYIVDDDFYQKQLNDLALNAQANHGDFLDHLSTIRILNDLNSNRRIS